MEQELERIVHYELTRHNVYADFRYYLSSDDVNFEQVRRDAE